MHHGLRSGFVFGEKKLINKFFDLRNVSALTVPTPIQIASEALWDDENHVIENRSYTIKNLNYSKITSIKSLILIHQEVVFLHGYKYQNLVLMKK